MKCWKCSNELTDGMSTCTYCGANLERNNPKSPEGAALRKLYDHYGADKLFENSALLVNGFGDLCPDEKKRKNQLKLIADSGVLKMYQTQLETEGRPSEAFKSRVEEVISENSGLSTTATNELMTIIDEMIGWIPDHTKGQNKNFNSQLEKAVEISKPTITNLRSIANKTEEIQSQRPIQSSSTNQVKKQKPKKTKREKITKAIRIVLSIAWLSIFLYLPISNGGLNKLLEMFTNIKWIAEVLFLFLVIYFLGIRRIK